MKYSLVLQQLSDQLSNRFHNSTPLPVKDYGWKNYIWTDTNFRWAHLEMFVTPKVSVLHCVVMPLPSSNAPVYGFDVIEMNGNLTGMFLDITPIVETNCNISLQQVGMSRPVPEWGDFFSDQFVCCVPDKPTDLEEGVRALDFYLSYLPHSMEPGLDYRPEQQLYVEGQRRNPQTFRMLKSFVGEEVATEFINQVLWPDVINNRDNKKNT
jgi:hypothetical protein